MQTDRNISVVCADDNGYVVDALRLLFTQRGFDWKGELRSADELLEFVEKHCPDIVLLDLDMPGADSFEVTAILAEKCPKTRVIVFSGHVRKSFVEQALEAGAWGYISKNDGESALLDAVGRVFNGDLVLSPEARLTYDQAEGN